MQNESVHLPPPRNQILNIAKGLGILLVVLGHYINVNSFPNAFIRSFHMPLFFIISGACFCFERNKEIVKFIKKRTVQLIIPLILFCIVTLFIQCMLDKNLNAVTNMHWQLPGVLWFLLILYLTELCGWILISLLKHKNHQKATLICLVVILLMLSITTSNMGLCGPFSICTIFAALSFYTIGYVFKNLIYNIPNYKCKRLQMLFSFAFCAIVVYIVGDSMQMYCNQINIFDVLTSLAGSWGIILLAENISISKNTGYNIVSWLGRNTLCIMCLHLPYIEIAFRLFGSEMDNYIIKHCVCILFVGIGLFLSTTFTNKYIPWLLGKGIYKNNK